MKCDFHLFQSRLEKTPQKEKSLHLSLPPWAEVEARLPVNKETNTNKKTLMNPMDSLVWKSIQ